MEFFGRLCFGPQGVQAAKFLHALEIDQGLLVHTANGDGGRPKKFKGEHENLGLNSGCARL